MSHRRADYAGIAKDYRPSKIERSQWTGISSSLQPPVFW
jgi:hypothetical protein